MIPVYCFTVSILFLIDLLLVRTFTGPVVFLQTISNSTRFSFYDFVSLSVPLPVIHLAARFICLYRVYIELF